MPKPFSDDRVIIRFDLPESIDLDEMADGFSALSRQYKKMLSDKGISDDEAPARLLVTRLETGSLETEIAAWGTIAWGTVQVVDASLILSDFTMRIQKVVGYFANKNDRPENLSTEDTKDFETFIKPLAGRKKSNLTIKNATFHEKTKDREIHASYSFNEDDIAHAFTNMGKETDSEEVNITSHKVEKNVALYWAQTNWVETKTKGRTGDKGIVEKISNKALPVFFVTEESVVKHQMVGGNINPSKVAFIVDVSVERAKGQPVSYTVMDLHEVVPLDDEDPEADLFSD